MPARFVALTCLFQRTGQPGVDTLATFDSPTFNAADYSFTDLTPRLDAVFALIAVSRVW